MKQKQLAEKLNIAAPNLNSYLSGKRGLSKDRAIRFEIICKQLGYDFPAQDWIFEPRKIKQQLKELKK